MRMGEIFFGPTNENDLVFQIFYSNTESGRRTHYIEHHHAECEISLIVAGECQWCVNGKNYHGSTGDVFLFGSNENHYLTQIIGESSLVLLNIRLEPRVIWALGGDTFNLKYLAIFLNHDSDFSNALDKMEPVSITVSHLMHEIYNECLHKKPEYPLIVKAKLLLILAALGRYYGIASFPSLPAEYNQHLDQLDQAISFINQHLTDELSLEAIAKEAGMSKSYFSTIFKKTNGISVWVYITRKRIDLAMQLLRDSILPIISIAEQCGFTSISNFNRCFRQVTGTSPRIYRKDFSSDRTNRVSKANLSSEHEEIYAE